MCPDPQLLSIFMDGELPSPWKEKMETHLTQCPRCKEKLEGFRRLFEEPGAMPELAPSDEEAAKDRVWQNLQPFVSGGTPRYGRSQFRFGLWSQRVSIPLPAIAAAAAIVIAVLSALWIRGGQIRSIDSAANTNMILATEDEMPGIIPADMSSVLQYLSSDGTDILIMRLPESRSFISSGEPAIINAADYSRRRP